ncbi:hypothetical protein Mal4_17920 [Maioricimonas rarisocia]|uniref:Uncharacterized protein n=1 Tax=Maioricimonas rarisocia TaxID=2528026 RepID=A0A517Z4S9_9PLAN|nr:hypothetical protein Mal4_17920 [Maioricimonas rarisocia]
MNAWGLKYPRANVELETALGVFDERKRWRLELLHNSIMSLVATLFLGSTRGWLASLTDARLGAASPCGIMTFRSDRSLRSATLSHCALRDPQGDNT